MKAWTFEVWICLKIWGTWDLSEFGKSGCSLCSDPVCLQCWPAFFSSAWLYLSLHSLALSVLYCLPRDVVLHWLPGWYTCSHSTHHLLDLNNSPYNHSLPHYSASFAIVSPLLCFVSSQSRNADFLKCVFPPVLPYFSPMIQIITLASATSLSLDNLPVYSSLFLTQTYSTYATCLES